MRRSRKELPSSGSPLLRLNSVCPYFTMFPFEFPYRVLSAVNSDCRVLDPFCGRGTTNFAARILGLQSVAVDSNDVAHAVAASKFIAVHPTDVIDLCTRILRDSPDPAYIPSGEFWSRCFHAGTLEQICKIREYLLTRCVSESAIALRALMLGILHGPKNKGAPTYLSNQMPRTYSTKPGSAIRFWDKHAHEPHDINVSEVVARRAWYSFSNIPTKTIGYALNADSRHLDSLLEHREFDITVTSPPYYGMRTYRPDQWLRNWFVGGPAHVEYREDGQLRHGSPNDFAAELSRVWKAVAAVSKPGARLVLRFGALPSIHSNPSQIIKDSLKRSDSGWATTTVKPAGSATLGRRQAAQFRHCKSRAYNEIDLYARLEA